MDTNVITLKQEQQANIDRLNAAKDKFAADIDALLAKIKKDKQDLA
jgi:hypothetical protein